MALPQITDNLVAFPRADLRHLLGAALKRHRLPENLAQSLVREAANFPDVSADAALAFALAQRMTPAPIASAYAAVPTPVRYDPGYRLDAGDTMNLSARQSSKSLATTYRWQYSVISTCPESTWRAWSTAPARTTRRFRCRWRC